MKKNRLLLALALSAACAASAAPSAPAASPLDGSFTCAAPRGWSARRLADGVIFSGPRDAFGVAATIIVRHVPPGDKLYDTPAAYMRRITQAPDVSPPGWSVGRVQDAVVAGRAAKRLVNGAAKFVPPNSFRAKRVDTREEHVAVPASHGFYVLVYDAPVSLFDRRHAAFAGLLASFRPKF
ncbi:MAG: hypothetical protein HKL90_09660 [Elusimicrobia bacterium]|nr:hypothetical protein [Elusimicrobiota bacterium]